VIARRYHLIRLERRFGLCVTLALNHIMIVVGTRMWVCVWGWPALDLNGTQIWTWHQTGRRDMLQLRWHLGLGWIGWRLPRENDFWFGPLHWNTIFPRIAGDARPEA
jgi:hypothetical protein